MPKKSKGAFVRLGNLGENAWKVCVGIHCAG